MKVKVFVNSIFNSNTYLLYKEDNKDVWLIDPGSSYRHVEQWIEENNKDIAGILLTHTHFDHILGLKTLLKINPHSKIYASVFARDGLKSEKLNGSLYMEIPYVVDNVDIIEIKENDVVELWNGVHAIVYETPGHDRDCISYHIADYLFSGDALIPGTKIYTKLKYSNIDKARKSINKIITQFNPETYIYAGHGDKCKLGEININELF